MHCPKDGAMVVRLTVSVIVIQLNVDTGWTVGRQTQLCVLERDVSLGELELQLLPRRHLVVAY